MSINDILIIGETMKKIIIYLIVISVVVISVIAIMKIKNHDNELKTINAIVIAIEDNKLVVKDENEVIYTFNFDSNDIEIGTNIEINYKDSNIIDYKIKSNPSSIPNILLDNGIFSLYYNMAYDRLKVLTLDEKIGQLFLVRYDEKNDIENLKKYKFGGYVFYKKDFDDKTTNEVKQMINNLQNNSDIPLITAVDEEGGKVIRISSNPNLYPTPFKSPSELYALGSFDLIKQDTIDKSKLLSSLGINLNLAPVVDVSTNPDDYMYDRSLGQSVDLTKEYAKVVIEASKKTKVSYTLKHFPGYGNNFDTHSNSSIDNRSYNDILNNDLPPFEEGIDAGAEAVLISHNIVTSIDSNNPASLSSKINSLLREDLDFTGIIITDDLDMGATNSIEDSTIKAILAGNNLLIITDYERINDVKSAVENGTISEDTIDELVFRVIAWKYYKGLMIQNTK